MKSSTAASFVRSELQLTLLLDKVEKVIKITSNMHILNNNCFFVLFTTDISIHDFLAVSPSLPLCRVTCSVPSVQIG